MSEVITGKRTIGEVSAESRALHKRLAEMKEGELISYEELSDIAGRNVQTIGYSSLASARKMAEQENRAVFGVERGKGLRRLKNSEIPSTADHSITHIRKTARKAAKTLSCVDYAALPNELRTVHNVRLSVLGVMVEATKSSSMRLLEEKVRGQSDQLPVGKVLEALKG